MAAPEIPALNKLAPKLASQARHLREALKSSEAAYLSAHTSSFPPHSHEQPFCVLQLLLP